MGKKDSLYWRDIEERIQELEEKSGSEEDAAVPLADAIKFTKAMVGCWELDPEKAAKVDAKELEKFGIRDANKVPSRPLSDAKNLTDNPAEQQVNKIYTSWCDLVVSAFHRFDEVMRISLAKIENRIRRISSLSEPAQGDISDNFYANEIAAIEDEAEVDLGLESRLAEAMNQFRSQKNLFRKFRDAHGLRRNPNFEYSSVAFLSIAIICIGTETVVNGFMYAQASESGLVGGWLLAFGLSAAIFSFSFVAGWVLREKNAMAEEHKRHGDGADEQAEHTEAERSDWQPTIVKPVIGWLGWALVSMIVLLLISFVCVYRDEASLLVSSADPAAEAMAQAWARLWAFDLFPRADIEGVLLILVNLSIMAIATYKGYTHSDIVPGYKEQALQFSRERRKFKKMIAEVRDDMVVGGKMLDERVSKLTPYSSEMVNQIVDQFDDGLVARKGLRAAVARQLELVEEECNSRLSAYRKGNEPSRPRPEPAPSYFQDRWELPVKPEMRAVARPGVDLQELDVEKAVRLIGAHHREATKLIRDAAKARYRDRLESYVTESETYQHEKNVKEQEHAREESDT